MNIRVLQAYDGFAVEVDGDHYYMNQEDTVELLVEVFRRVAPEATVSFEEVY